MKSISKRGKIAIIAVVAVVILAAAGFLWLYINASAIRFDYYNARTMVADENSDALSEQGFGVDFPYFGNKAVMEDAHVFSFPFGIGEENIPIYQAINTVLDGWALDVSREYNNLVKCDYTVENNGKTLTVDFDVTAYPDGLDAEPQMIEKTFVFDIENVSVDNLPKLIS